jgi:ParB-like chromosome segregation protein Spo0J
MGTQAADHGQLQVEWWPLDGPQPYDANPRIIGEQAVAKVAASLREYGWHLPIVVDEQGVIIAGHARPLAARELDLDRVPVHVARGLSPEKVAAYRLMDNRSADEAQWHFDLLQTELEQLLDGDFEMALTGFDEAEIATVPTSDGVEFPEYDESLADEVETITCLECGHTWPV